MFIHQLSITEPSVPAAPALEKADSVAAADEDDGEDAGPKVLSKKEKEKLKKEREKASRRAEYDLRH